jgi:predicted dienelactone hydrolase
MTLVFVIIYHVHATTAPGDFLLFCRVLEKWSPSDKRQETQKVHIQTSSSNSFSAKSYKTQRSTVPLLIYSHSAGQDVRLLLNPRVLLRSEEPWTELS